MDWGHVGVSVCAGFQVGQADSQHRCNARPNSRRTFDGQGFLVRPPTVGYEGVAHSRRWTFYINLPTCGAAFVLLFFTLKLNPTKKHTFRELSQTFDFLGM